LGNDYISLKALVKTIRFMSGRSMSLWETALYMKGIIAFDNTSSTPISYTGYPIQISMTSSQYREYLSHLSQDRNPEKISAIQITNFIYPDPLQQMHNIPRDRRPQLPQDKLYTDGGWVESSILKELPERSPKLVWLEKYFQQYPGKHVIYTSFNEYHGVKILSTLLKMLGHHVITITGNDSQKDRAFKIGEFKEICITNLYPFTDFPDVKSLIFFEQLSDDSLLNNYLKRLPNQITVLFFISSGPNGEPTLETSNYLKLVSQLEIRNTLIELLRNGTAELDKVRKNLGVPQLTQVELDRYFQLRQ
jgi:hypothetical protein